MLIAAVVLLSDISFCELGKVTLIYSSLCVMPKGVDDHALPNFSTFTSMNKVISICGVGPMFNII